MIDILLHTIPRFLFEPIAISGLIGLAIALFNLKNKKNTLSWIILISLCFMLGWRIFIQIISSRYAAILIYPIVIATAYGCLKFKKINYFIPQLSSRIAAFFPWVLIIGLTITCVGKTLSYNPYSDHIAKAGTLIAEDATNYADPVIFTMGQECLRLSYYSGLPAFNLIWEKKKDKQFYHDSENWFRHLGISPCTTAYLLLFERKSKTKFNAISKTSDEILKNTEFLGEFYHNKKKKRVSRVYRCNIAKAFSFSMQPVTDIPQKEMCHENNFITSAIRDKNSKYYAHVNNYFQKRPLLQCPSLKNFPTDWDAMWNPGYRQGSNSELGLVKFEKKIVAFRLKSDKNISVCFNKKFATQKWTIKMIVSGKPGTNFSAAFHCYDSNGNWENFFTLPAASIEGTDTYVYSLVLPDSYWNESISVIRPAINLINGELFVYSMYLQTHKK